MISLFIFLVIVAVILALINKLDIDPAMRNIIYLVAIVLVLLYLFQMFPLTTYPRRFP